MGAGQHTRRLSVVQAGNDDGLVMSNRGEVQVCFDMVLPQPQMDESVLCERGVKVTSRFFLCHWKSRGVLNWLGSNYMLWSNVMTIKIYTSKSLMS